MCPVTSTSCNLCTSKVWSCYIAWLISWCIYKKKHYLTLTLGSRSHEMLPSTLDIMWAMHQQSLILLHPMVNKLMHLQENTLFNHDLWVKVARNVTQCHLHHSLKLLRQNVSEEIDLQVNSIFDLWPWPWSQGHTKWCPVPSTSCDLFSYKVWSCYV